MKFLKLFLEILETDYKKKSVILQVILISVIFMSFPTPKTDGDPETKHVSKISFFIIISFCVKLIEFFTGTRSDCFQKFYRYAIF